MTISDFITAIIVFFFYENMADNDDAAAADVPQILELDTSISFDDLRYGSFCHNARREAKAGLTQSSVFNRSTDHSHISPNVNCVECA